MVRKIIISLIVLILALLLTGCGKDPFESDNVELKPYVYYAEKGDTLEDIYGVFYERNTVFVSWEEFRQKHRELNARLTKNGRALQIGDEIIGFSVHRKENK